MFFIAIFFAMIAVAAVIGLVIYLFLKNQKNIANAKVGWIVQVNDLVFETFKGSSTDPSCCCPAAVVFCLDERDGYDPKFMKSIADYLLKNRTNSSADGSLKKILVDLFKQKFVKNRVYPIPESVTDGAEVFFGHVEICRKELPKRKLTRDYVRIHVNEDDIESGISFVRYHPDDGKLPALPDRR